jgi:hypothetical protein
MAVRRQAWLNILDDARRRAWEACPYDEIEVEEFQWEYEPPSSTTAFGQDTMIPEFTPLKSIQPEDWMQWIGEYSGVIDYFDRDSQANLPDQIVVEFIYSMQEACQRLGVDPDRSISSLSISETSDDLKWLLAHRDENSWGDLTDSDISEIGSLYRDLMYSLDDARQKLEDTNESN